MTISHSVYPIEKLLIHMPTLLQVNSCLNIMSTGKIAENIGTLAVSKGWNCYMVHGARYVNYPSCMRSIQASTKWDEYLHFAESFLFDRHGLGSRFATWRVIRQIQEIAPDIIHLHNIHGYYLNYRLLFEYLSSAGIPIVWTFHDCWAFTGHCAFPNIVDCNKWKSGCHKCPMISEYPKSFSDRSQANWREKRELFRAMKNLTIVPVSDWMAGLVRESFFKSFPVKTIHNGIDLDVFLPYCNRNEFMSRYKIPGNCKIILGAASTWDSRKGLNDFIKLSAKLSSKVKIILVGLNDKQLQNLPNNIVGISRTRNIQQMVELYSVADVFVNPTYADTLPTVNIEALACGTPVITYNTGGAPEIVDRNTGIVVPQGNIEELVKAIENVLDSPLSRELCRERAVNNFNKKDRFLDYLRLYGNLSGYTNE